MFRLIKQIINPVQNNRGNILVSAFITMVIISMSVAGIAQLTVNQYRATTEKIEDFTTDLLGEALLEQAVYEFEDFLANNDYDFSAYFAAHTTNGYTLYGILVEDVTGTTDENGDYTAYVAPDAYVYRFTYTTDEGLDMRMYVHISSVGSYTENLDPFDFAIATNGYLVMNGGYLRNPSMYADTIVFTNASPYFNYGDNVPQVTLDSNAPYPDFNGNGGTTANVYYSSGFWYCQYNCYDVGTVQSDPFIIQTDEFLDIFTTSLETGAVNEDKVISDFFGGFTLSDEIIDFVKNDGPTESRTITSAMSLATIASVVIANSGDPEETCVDTHPSPNKEVWVCYSSASSEPYTYLNNDTNFNPTTESETLNYAGVYEGDLEINHDFYIDNLETETLIVTGDLIFNNTADIELNGLIVVLGDLYFSGDSVAVGGGFYVLGQTFIEFNEDEGFEDYGTGNDYSFSLQTMDNVLITSLWESHDSNDAVSGDFNWLIYTEESIYADGVNSRLFVNGVFFANAKGASGNEIPMEDEYGNPVRGIVLNAMNGYVRDNGNEVVRNNYTTIDFDPVNEGNLQDEFMELPVFDTILISEGVYSTERSEIFYN